MELLEFVTGRETAVLTFESQRYEGKDFSFSKPMSSVSCRTDVTAASVEPGFTLS